MANYSPYPECCAGLLWAPDTDRARQLLSDTDAFGAVLTADTNDTIGKLWGIICARYTIPSCITVEVYDITDGLPDLDPLTLTTYRPASDLINVTALGRGAFSGFSATETDIYQAINNTTQTPGTFTITDGSPERTVDDNSFIWFQRGEGFEYAYQVDGLTGSYAGGEWLTRLRMSFVVQRFSDDDKASVTVSPYLMVGGTRFPAGAETVTDEAAGGHTFTRDWWVNPTNGRPWTSNVIDLFDVAEANTGYGFGLTAYGSGSDAISPLVFQSWIEVEHAATDPRIAIAGWCSSVKQGWQSFTLIDPADGTDGDVPLVAGNRYLFLFRRGTGHGQALCLTDEAGVALPSPPLWTSMDVQMDPVSHRPLGLGEEDSRVMGLLLEDGDLNFSLDSQFYATSSPEGLDSPDAWPDINAYFRMSPVDETHMMRQEFTPEATDDYGWLRINVCLAVGYTDGDLYLRIKDGTQAQVGDVITITQDDLDAPRTRWRTLGLRVGDYPLISGDQYSFEAISYASHRTGWLVQVANAGMTTGDPPQGPPEQAWEVRYGGANTPSDQLIVTASGVSTHWDSATAEINISTIPDGPSLFDAYADTEVCDIAPVVITWLNPTLPEVCGGFGSTEIERSDNEGATWYPICHITDEFVELFEDYEWQGKHSTLYRARTFRGDGVPSDYTTEIEVDISQGRCGLAFVSNEQPDLNVFYPDVGLGSVPERTFSWPRERQVFQPLNRDYQVVFTGLEDRGTVQSVELFVRGGPVNDDQTPCVADPCADYTLRGEDVFDPLKDIAFADLSYVCVRNEEANRWFANLEVPEGTWNVEGDMWAAPLNIIEVTDRPSTPDSAAGS